MGSQRHLQVLVTIEKNGLHLSTASLLRNDSRALCQQVEVCEFGTNLTKIYTFPDRADMNNSNASLSFCGDEASSSSRPSCPHRRHRVTSDKRCQNYDMAWPRLRTDLISQPASSAGTSGPGAPRIALSPGARAQVRLPPQPVHQARQERHRGRRDRRPCSRAYRRIARCLGDQAPECDRDAFANTFP